MGGVFGRAVFSGADELHSARKCARAVATDRGG